MKAVKMLAVIGVAGAMASQCFAVSAPQLWKLSLNGSSYSANDESNKLESAKFNTTKGTNLVAKCSGVRNNESDEPGSVSFTVSGAFKPAKDCAQ
jgi:hypothetical protein